MPIHRVAQGDCISSIAERYGFFWSSLWNHADNAPLKEKRKNPNALLPGDTLAIPEKQMKEASCSTETRHRFTKKGTPAKLKIRLVLDDQPRANESYQLEIDGEWVDGSTDGDGYLEQWISPGASRGLLRIGSAERVDEYVLAFGTLDPIDTDSGVKGRLTALGYRIDGDDLIPAISTFQKDEQLNVTGAVDEPTRNRLKERFGQ